MKRTILIALAVALTIPVFAAERVIPIVGVTAGANGSAWQTEMLLHNSGADSYELVFELHDAAGAVQSAALTLEPHQTRILRNVILDLFDRHAATGALIVRADEIAMRKLAISTRTFTGAGGTELGQNVPSYDPEGALGPGDTGVIPGPSDPLVSRFNFGIFSIDASTIEWNVIRANGEAAATAERSYEAGRQVQYNGGVSTLLGVAPEPGDVIYARVRSGRALVYGSAINQITNDPSFVEFERTRENLLVKLVGVDLDENGTVDIFDANGDGTLDAPVVVFTIGYPNYFRVVVRDPEGHLVTMSVGGSQRGVTMDSRGTVKWVPSGALAGRTDTLLVNAYDGIDVTTFSVPVIYR